jgi:uncharacterized membrane protein YukC
VRAVNRALSEAQRKVKENKKKRQYDRKARQDRGEDVLNTDEEDEEEKEGELKDCDGGVAWDALLGRMSR